MVIEFEVNSSNHAQISFLKKHRWSNSKIIRKVNGGKLYFSKNTQHYDNADSLLRRILILPDGTLLSFEESPKKFNLLVKNSKKSKAELKGIYVPSFELIDMVRNICSLGCAVLRTIGDKTDLGCMEKFEICFEQFNKSFSIRESMEIKFLE